MIHRKQVVNINVCFIQSVSLWFSNANILFNTAYFNFSLFLKVLIVRRKQPLLKITFIFLTLKYNYILIECFSFDLKINNENSYFVKQIVLKLLMYHYWLLEKSYITRAFYFYLGELYVPWIILICRLANVLIFTS